VTGLSPSRIADILPGIGLASRAMALLARRHMTGAQSPAPADHDGIEVAGADRDAAGEALRIEDLQQAGERVGVAVVRGGRKEQPVLEPRREVPDGPGELAVDREREALAGAAW